MINPILYTIHLGSIQIPIRWYGLLIVTGAVAASFYAAWYIKRRGYNPDIVWDSLIWLLVSGILGARIWYVVNDMLGGSTRYLQNPAEIPQIWLGGLNILGGVVVAALVGWWYTKKYHIDFWLLADAAGPALLLGQAIGRWGNFINQELYGPPTTLPWGIPIDAAHRIAPWTDLTAFPEATTRFHPTFAYQMIWNLFWWGVMVYLIIRLGKKLKPGYLAGMWLVVAGVGRTWVEFFRPDQPRFLNTPVHTSMLIAIGFALVGVFILLARSGKISVKFIPPAPDDYAPSEAPSAQQKQGQQQRRRRRRR